MIKIGIVQDTPVLFDREKTIDKTESIIMDARPENYQLLLFPEAFIPGYPRGLSFGTTIGNRTEAGREMFLRFAQNSIDVPGPYTDRLGSMAKKAKTYLAIGVSEKDRVSGTLYCTLLYFNPEGRLIGKHRKIKPTASERIIWGEGDGTTLTTIDSRIGKIGGLICWENYMPLARMAMYRKGVQLFLAPTADNRDSWSNLLAHIAIEGRCYVFVSNQFVKESDYPDEFRKTLQDPTGIMSRGGSVAYNPSGKIIAGPLYDTSGILSAEIDLGEVQKGKMDLDVAGHYSRDDIFSLIVKDQPASVKDFP